MVGLVFQLGEKLQKLLFQRKLLQVSAHRTTSIPGLCLLSCTPVTSYCSAGCCEDCMGGIEIGPRATFSMVYYDRALSQTSHLLLLYCQLLACLERTGSGVALSWQRFINDVATLCDKRQCGASPWLVVFNDMRVKSFAKLSFFFLSPPALIAPCQSFLPGMNAAHCVLGGRCYEEYTEQSSFRLNMIKPGACKHWRGWELGLKFRGYTGLWRWGIAKVRWKKRRDGEAHV